MAWFYRGTTQAGNLGKTGGVLTEKIETTDITVVATSVGGPSTYNDGKNERPVIGCRWSR